MKGCVFIPTNCDDKNPCTNDFCNKGDCYYTPVTCNDNDACTKDSCNQDKGGCIHDPVLCDDNNKCTTDACSNSTGGCTFTDVNCEDGDRCTIDYCDSVLGCSHNKVIWYVGRLFLLFHVSYSLLAMITTDAPLTTVTLAKDVFLCQFQGVVNHATLTLATTTMCARKMIALMRYDFPSFPSIPCFPPSYTLIGMHTHFHRL